VGEINGGGYNEREREGWMKEVKRERRYRKREVGIDMERESVCEEVNIWSERRGGWREKKT
jgi:hypothetical protein